MYEKQRRQNESIVQREVPTTRCIEKTHHHTVKEEEEEANALAAWREPGNLQAAAPASHSRPLRCRHVLCAANLSMHILVEPAAVAEYVDVAVATGHRRAGAATTSR